MDTLEKEIVKYKGTIETQQESIIMLGKRLEASAKLIRKLEKIGEIEIPTEPIRQNVEREDKLEARLKQLETKITMQGHQIEKQMKIRRFYQKE